MKQRVLREYASKYHLNVLVETGTYFGDMIAAMAGTFDEIYSIELSPMLYEHARARFRSSSHIHLIHGDSGIVLPVVLERLTGPALFWLDGHYSGDITALGSKETPILDELTHIFLRRDPGHVVIIDDARCFGSDPAYPSIDEVGACVRTYRPDRQIVTIDDSIRIIPG